MKNSMIRIVFIGFVCSVMFAGTVLGQALKEQISCEDKEKIISRYAKFLTETQEHLIDFQVDAIDQMSDDLFLKEKIAANGNSGIWHNTILRVSSTMVDMIYEETFRKFPLASTIVETVNNLNEKDNETKKFKAKNNLIDLKNDLRRAINSKRVENHETYYYEEIMKQYNVTPLNCEIFLENLEKEIKELEIKEKQLSNLYYFELISYQALLNAWYSVSKGKSGYMSIYIDYSNTPRLDLWEKPSNIKNPRLVRISLKAGDYSKKIETRLNELISLDSKYQTVLELDDIPKLIYCKFQYKIDRLIVEHPLPIIKIRDKVIYPWKDGAISLTTYYASGGGVTKTWDREKIYNKSNKFGHSYKTLFLAPYNRVYTMQGTYKTFAEYTTD
jgi:hypothetical protein